MTSTPATSESANHVRSKSATIALWLLAGTAIAGVLALLLSHAPARLRLIGLLGAVQGAACGWLVSQAGRVLRMRFPAVAGAGGFVFGTGTVALTMVLWWQVHAEQLRAAYTPPKGAAMAAAILNQAGESTDPQTRLDLQEYRRALKSAGALPPDTSFVAYLEFRASSIWQSRLGGQILFATELLLAGILCAGFARATAGNSCCEICGNWITPIRSGEFSGEAADEISRLVEPALQSGRTCHRAEVTLSRCRCQRRPPDVLIRLEYPDDPGTRHLSTADEGSPLVLTDEIVTRLAERIDAAQGLRQTGP